MFVERVKNEDMGLALAAFSAVTEACRLPPGVERSAVLKELVLTLRLVNRPMVIARVEESNP